MESKNTEELLQIWRENDRAQYSEEAFEAVRLLIEERGEKVVPQRQTTHAQPVEGGIGDFFSFRTMISTALVKVLYVLDLIGITASGIVMIIRATQERQASGEQILVGVAVIVLGNLLWRLVCEGSIVLFSIHDILGSIEREMKK
jgi:hypothetical protein